MAAHESLNPDQFWNQLGIGKEDRDDMVKEAAWGATKDHIDSAIDSHEDEGGCFDCGAESGESCKRGCVNMADEELEHQPQCESCGAKAGKECRSGCDNEGLYN